MPKPNYAFAKRQRELAKKQKKEAKKQQKINEQAPGPQDAAIPVCHLAEAQTTKALAPGSQMITHPANRPAEARHDAAYSRKEPRMARQSSWMEQVVCGSRADLYL